jgi:hypothetical protein
MPNAIAYRGLWRLRQGPGGIIHPTRPRFTLRGCRRGVDTVGKIPIWINTLRNAGWFLQRVAGGSSQSSWTAGGWCIGYPQKTPFQAALKADSEGVRARFYACKFVIVRFLYTCILLFNLLLKKHKSFLGDSCSPVLPHLSASCVSWALQPRSSDSWACWGIA